MFDRVKRAWAVWMLANSSYGCMLDSTFGYDRTGGTSKKLANKRVGFTVDYAVRLQQVQIECCDALRIIRNRDTPDAFFYIDPPYVGADQGHYDGYSQEDFDNLLGLLETMQGKFLQGMFHDQPQSQDQNRNPGGQLSHESSGPGKEARLSPVAARGGVLRAVMVFLYSPFHIV
jgi:DNA adenine methylase